MIQALLSACGFRACSDRERWSRILKCLQNLPRQMGLCELMRLVVCETFGYQEAENLLLFPAALTYQRLKAYIRRWRFPIRRFR